MIRCGYPFSYGEGREFNAVFANLFLPLFSSTGYFSPCGSCFGSPVFCDCIAMSAFVFGSTLTGVRWEAGSLCIILVG